ncbi:class A beta-lactamase [Sphingomonas naphthae]|uniref:Beta-lactamase n=1 Tax=Sphingomonas naphthae TaxID=1813468 RepID=A0ABY7TTQ5_9SPHN|nr:class A beta-lactamase [Sphingomonas naphthae]WCT75249.1 class A beta-lactamase [Sphingomonas naphthae]
MDRRLFLAGGLLAGPALARSVTLTDPALAALEAKSGGRLGVALLDTGSGRMTGYRRDERFPMCSTFKALLAAVVLSRVDRGEELLDRQVMYGPADLVTYSPGTAPNAGKGMAMGDICAAAVTLSDNSAANLMLASLGGPEGFTRFARSLGDTVTRLDRIETALNSAIPGDPRDTTSPAAMARSLRAVLTGPALKPASREQLAKWMIANTTGDARIRAAAPAGWRVGDKTGTGAVGSTGDVAILWPPKGAPLVLAVYVHQGPEGTAERNALIAEAARIMLPG